MRSKLNQCVLLLPLLFLATAHRASACMQPEYSFYYTYSGDANHNLYVDATLDGYTNMVGCDFGPNIVHTPDIWNLGNESEGPGVYPSDNIDFTYQQQTVLNPGTLLTVSDEEGDVYCSESGLFFSDILPPFQFEWAQETTITSGGATGCVYIPGANEYQCTFAQLPWCSNCITTNPPGPGGIVQQARDMNVLTVIGYGKTNPVIPYPFYSSQGPCVRLTSSGPGGWACAIAISNGIANGSLPLQECTFYPYQP